MAPTRMFVMARHLCTGIAILAAAAACKGDGPQIPTAFTPTAGIASQYTGVVATVIATPPQVTLLDAKSKPIKGARVKWRTGANSGSVVNDSSFTDASGIALSGGWTLGTSSGVQTLTATAEAISPVTFTAQVGPGPVANLVRISADGQQATVNTPVSEAPVARAQDVFGNPVPGVAVTFGVAFGGGTVTDAQQTSDANGLVRAALWTLGKVAGQQVVQANALNASQAVWVATALAGPASELAKWVGDSAQGIAGFALAPPPAIKVTDAFGNYIGNVPVTFTPGPNSGTVTNSTIVSDPANGIAIVGSWVLGTAPTQRLIATSSALPGKSATFTATAVNSQFRLEVRFVGDGGTPDIRQAFLNAASKWRRMIVGHVHDQPISTLAGNCLPWVPAINETISDLVIYARIGPIDQGGSGGINILAQAGPCRVAPSSRLTLMGVMEFDEYDVPSMIANGTFGDVVLHEMGHVLGVGTLWDQFGRSLLVGARGAAPNFIGSIGLAQFLAVNSLSYVGNPVPVEGNQFGPGTADGHWRQSVFGRELMQGFARAGGMPLSRITVGSLQDLGYLVNLGAADSYTIPSPILQGFVAADLSPGTTIGERLIKPVRN